jgi:hypothetical protein
MNMKKWLDIGTNLVVIAMAAALVFTFFHYRLAPWQQTQPPAQVQAGATLKPVPGVPFALAGDTLLLAVRDGCHFCEDSMPFYKKLLALKSDGKISIPIVAVLPDSATVAYRFLSSHGVAIPIAPNVNLATIGVLGTPTMILVGAKRTVQQVWAGEQNPTQQTGVIAELESLAGPVESGPTGRRASSAGN